MSIKNTLNLFFPSVITEIILDYLYTVHKEVLINNYKNINYLINSILFENYIMTGDMNVKTLSPHIHTILNTDSIGFFEFVKYSDRIRVIDKKDINILT